MDNTLKLSEVKETLKKERQFAESTLTAMGASEELETSESTVKKRCNNENVRFSTVKQLITDYIEIKGKGYGDNENSKYKLNAKGIDFVIKGCWIGIEASESARLHKENEEQRAQIARLLSEGKKNRCTTIFAAVLVVVISAIISVLIPYGRCHL
jgi:hypothetical protein